MATKGQRLYGDVWVDGATASELIATDANKALKSLPVATYPSLAELAHVKGVTSAVQTQIDAKLNTDQTTPQPITGGALQVNNGVARYNMFSYFV